MPTKSKLNQFRKDQFLAAFRQILKAAFDLPLNQAVHLKLNKTFVTNSVTHFGRNPFRLKDKSDDTLIKIEKSESELFTIRIGRGLLCNNSDGLYEGELPKNTSDNTIEQEDDSFRDDGSLPKEQPDHMMEDTISNESEIMEKLNNIQNENRINECLWEIILLGDVEVKDPFERLYKDDKEKKELKDTFRPGIDFFKNLFSRKHHNQFEMLSGDVPNFALDTLHRQPTLLELERVHSYLYNLRRKKRKIVIKQGERCFMGDTIGSCERTSIDSSNNKKSDNDLENSYNEQAIFILQTVSCEIKEAEKPQKDQGNSTEDDPNNDEDDKNPDKNEKKPEIKDKDDAKIAEKYGEPGEIVKPLLESLKKEKKKKRGWKWPSWKGFSLPSLCNLF